MSSIRRSVRVDDLTAVPPVADCEARDGVWFAQEVNAWSSLAYVAVGAIILVSVMRRNIHRAFLVLGALMVAEGVGSVLYHGRPSDAARVVHDAALVAGLGFVAGWHLGRLRTARRADQAERVAIAGAVFGLLAGVVGGVVSASTTNVVVAAMMVVIVAAELVARRRGRTVVWNLPLVVLVAAAFATWLSGTGDSPLCDSESWAQPHALWHMLSAIVVLAWMDLAVAAEWPDRAPRLFRRAVDRLLGLLCKVLTHAFHRSVQVTGLERWPRDRPVLVVANHGNGFVDPIVVSSVLGRLPRFLAKAALWRVTVARPFLALAGVLPVYRSSDGDRPGDNASVFEACHHELARKSTVAIFPEGTTDDRAGLDRVRSGAARIALGAVATAPDLVIVPIGLAFESRLETRSRAFVMIGDPLAVVALPGDQRHEVDELTARIADALEAVSPEFDTVEEREVLRASARTTLDNESRRGVASFGEVEVLARRLATAPAPERVEIIERFRRYAAQLQLIGLTDRELSGTRSSTLRVVLSVVALIVLGSLVATATLIHLPAVVLVVVATGAVQSTATKGTVRLIVGLVAGLITWVIAGIVIADGSAAFVAGAVVAVEGAIALAVWAPLTRVASTLWAWLQVRDRAGLLPPVLLERDALVGMVRETAGAESW